MSALIETSLSALLVVSLKAILLALLAGMCLAGLRISDRNVQHRVWSAVLLAMFLMPVLGWVTASLPLPAVPLSTAIAPLQPILALFERAPQSRGVPKGIGPAPNHDASSDPLASHAPPTTAPSSSHPGSRHPGIQQIEQGSPKRRAELKSPAATIESRSALATVGQSTATAAWTKLLFATYAVGLTVMFGRLCLGGWGTHRIIKRGRRVHPPGAEGAIVVESDVVRVPLTVGIIRPRILLPADWPSWNAEILTSVLRHEQTHIERKDLLVALLAEINHCLYWFHPLAWLLRKRLAALAELSCDDSVISATGDRTGYARHLLEIAGRMSGGTTRVAPLGVSMARTSQVESRIDAILDAKRPLARQLGRRKAAGLAAVVLPLVLLTASVRAVDDERNTRAEQVVADTSETVVREQDKDDSVPLNVPDGFWAKFQIETKVGDTTERSLLTIVLLDKTTRQEQACRWIEAIQEYEGDRETVITRLLVPEVHLRIGVDVLEKAVVVLQRVGDQPPIDYTELDRSEIQSDFNLVMPIRHDVSQPHGPEPVDLNVGGSKMTIPLPGWTNRRIESEKKVNGLRREIVTRRWVMESDPFPGVMKTQETISRIDPEKSIVSTTTVAMADGGMGARSQFTDSPLPPFAITPGWEWALSPRGYNYATMGTRGIVIRLDKDGDSLRLTLAYPWGAQGGEYYIKHRPVAFDADRKRYEFKHNGITASGGVGLGVFNLEEIAPIDSIVDIGIERLTKQGLQVFAESAAKPARDAGLEPLPFPVVGQPYTLNVTTTENQTIRSEDLLGKVVLIDCWATWCAPCMAKMPKLKAIYEKWHPDGFEVIGVNLDDSTELMQKMVDAKELPWPQVKAPTDSKKLELWGQACGLTSLPRLLLLDRQGNLHADCSPHDLEQLVEQLMRGR